MESLLIRQLVLDRLDAASAFPSSSMNQHFLVTDRGIDLLTSQIDPRAHVIEVGSGIGHTSEAIASRAASVLGVEKDPKFRELLLRLQETHQNIRFVIADILRIDRKKLIEKRNNKPIQVVSNLPFNIIGPFLQVLADFPFTDSTLILGGRSYRSIISNRETDPDFDKLSVMGEVFYDISHLGSIPSGDYYPEPGTDTEVIYLQPKDHRLRTRRQEVLGDLLVPRNAGYTVESIITRAYEIAEGVLDKMKGKDTNKARRRNEKRWLNKLVSNYNNSTTIKAETMRIRGSSNGGFIRGLPSELKRKQARQLNTVDWREISCFLR